MLHYNWVNIRKSRRTVLLVFGFTSLFQEISLLLDDPSPRLMNHVYGSNKLRDYNTYNLIVHAHPVAKLQ